MAEYADRCRGKNHLWQGYGFDILNCGFTDGLVSAEIAERAPQVEVSGGGVPKY